MSVSARNLFKRVGIATLSFVLAISSVSTIGPFMLAQVANAAAPVSVYDGIPAVQPSSYPSLGYQATRTKEFGDEIQLAGTNRHLNTVTVSLTNWACENDATRLSGEPCVTTPGSTFTHPVTLNLYSVVSGAPGALLATKTQNVSVPFRPSADLTNCTGDKWYDGTTCNSGFAFDVQFDFSAGLTMLPASVIATVAYNTQSYGASPIGANGPYNSLNVSLATTAPTTGVDVNSDVMYWDTTYPGYTGGLIADSGWTPYHLAIRISATRLATPTLVSPANNAYVDGASLTNSWSAVPGASSYLYQSYNDAGATSLRFSSTYTTTSKTALNVADSVFWWRVTAIDAYGNTSESTPLWKVTVGNTAPIVTVDTSLTNQTTPTVSGTINDATAAVEITVDGSTYAAVNNGATWTATITNALVSDGTYDITATATDLAGNSSTDATADELTVDTTKPVVVITNPTAAYLSGNGIFVRGTIADTHLKAYELTITNAADTAVYSQTDSGASASAEYTWDTTAVADGLYKVTLRATDAAGNTKSASQFFTVDNTAPTKPGTPTTTPNPTNSQNVTWLWGASSDGSGAGVGAYEYKLNGDAWIFTGFADATINTNGLTEGTHTLLVRATDNAGNTGNASELGSVLIDLTAPVVVLSADDTTVGNNTPVQITATISEAHGYTYELTLDGVEVTLPADFLISGYVFSTTGLLSGPYVFELTATDTAGNVGSDTITVTVDNTAPVITYTGYDQAGGVITPRITITGQSAYSWTPSSSNPAGVSYDATLQSPVFTVTATGTYAYALTAVDEYGNTSSFAFAFNHTAPTPTAVSTFSDVIAQQVSDDQADGDTTVDGVSTTADTSVAGASDSSGPLKIFGIAWYWILAIIAALAGLWLLLAALLRRRQNNS